MSNEWIKSKYHAGIFGETGAGKTVLANHIYGSPHYERVCFFLNVQEKGYIRGLEIQASNPKGMLEKIKRGLDNGRSRFNIIPASENGVDELKVLTPLMFKMAKGGAKIAVFVDECQDIAPSNQKGTVLHKIHKKGREPGTEGGGIKSFALTQSPASVDNDILRQSKYHVWVGEPNKMEKSYLNSFDFPTQRVRDLNTSDGCMFEESGGEVISHCYTVVKNGEVMTGPHLAKEKYSKPE